MKNIFIILIIKNGHNLEYSNFNLTKEAIPSPHALHGSYKNDNLQILIYSGRTDLNIKNDDLCLFDYLFKNFTK